MNNAPQQTRKGFENEGEFVITTKEYSLIELHIAHQHSSFSPSQNFSPKEALNVNVSAILPFKRRRSLWSNALVLAWWHCAHWPSLAVPVSAQEPGAPTSLSHQTTPASGVGIQAGSALATIIYFPSSSRLQSAAEWSAA